MWSSTSRVEELTARIALVQKERDDLAALYKDTLDKKGGGGFFGGKKGKETSAEAQLFEVKQVRARTLVRKD